MFIAPALALLMIAVATAAGAEDRAHGPERWVGNVDLLNDEAVEFSTPGKDPLTRLIDHCKRNPVGVRPLLTLLPPAAGDRAESAFPTIALFARAHGRTLVSLTRVQPRADTGQDVVLQRTLVSDLFAGKRFSLTVYEDHTLGETATRLMGVGTRMTFRPSLEVAGWKLRFEVLGSYDLESGPSGYLAITGALQVPAMPPPIHP